MKTDIYLKLQKKFGGKWVATDKTGGQVLAKAANIEKLFAALQKKRIHPRRTAIGYIEKYGQVSAYISLSLQRN